MRSALFIALLWLAVDPVDSNPDQKALEQKEQSAGRLKLMKDTAARIETLYLATLSRKPRPEELARLVKYVEHGGREEVTFVAFADAIKNVVNNTPTQIRSASTKDNALADVLWAILNSSEFILNH